MAHLIENEIPLGHMSSNDMTSIPVSSDPNLSGLLGRVADAGKRQSTDDSDIVGGVLMENGGVMSNQRSGSYSNLYPDGSDLSQQRVTIESEGHYSNLPQLNMTDETRGLAGRIRGSVEEVVDADAVVSAQQHVYSNINGDGEPVLAVEGNSGQPEGLELEARVRDQEQEKVSGGVSNGALSWRDTSSSTLMADDMDLDDLSTVATAFRGKSKSKGSRKGEKISSDSSVSSASSRQPETSTPLKGNGGGGGGKANKKHIIPIVAVIETSNNVNNVLNCPRPEGGGGEQTKLQMLHDTTMIDCALDLDSLDTVMDSGRQPQQMH